ncbi:MAG: aminotransferase class I/II-fold pyridoxal phosphate-dependent enzyme [Ignavibacteria bacterium]|nr:aminotransferase class I/II-fold pyridoxal phosphate-dependent enzyme [Ignavibacteria bacterium]
MRMIDLRSDTVTKPSKEMREFMLNAEVGDDVYGEDPSVNRLQEKVADLLGKETALFVPSGTMANQLCIKTHTQPWDELICDRDAHILNYESGSIAGISHVQVLTANGNRGIFTAEQVEELIRPEAYYLPKTKLVCVENTHNRGAGSIFPIEEIKRIKTVCEKYNLKYHLDGARLWNASIATGISMKEFASHFDSVSVCLSKGMGAPVGSVIAGTKEFIKLAHRYRKAWGGGMRQAGILAAAGIYAIENNYERLADDHRRAKYFAEEISQLPSIELDPASVETNIILFGVKGLTANEIAAKVKTPSGHGNLLLLSVGKKFLARAVMHLNVYDEDVEEAIQILKSQVGKD